MNTLSNSLMGLLPLGVRLGMIVAIGFLSGSIAQLFLPSSGIEAKQSALRFETISLPSDKAFGLIEVAEKKPQKEAAKESVKEKTYPLTALKIKGIYYQKRGSFILLADGKKKTKFLEPQESFKGYKLVEIYPEYAIFERNKKRYELRIMDAKGVKTKRVNSAKKKSTRFQAPASPEARQSLSSISRDELKSYQQDMGKIWRNIAINPYRVSGKIEGFQVVFIKPNSIFAKLGIQKGDILTAMNGNELKSMKDAFDAYKKVNSIDAIRMTLLRNNEERELEYAIH